jgi:putative membrane protein
VFSQAALNATLNGTSAVLLIAGYTMIRQRKIQAHRAFMIAAFICSTAFLISYVIYHIRVGNVLFQGQGWIRPVYFTLLISHVLLAVAILPLALITLSRALREQFDKHRRIARWTLPLWLYVSVTGVIIYVMLYHLYAPSV